jgi:hypothetical protein
MTNDWRTSCMAGLTTLGELGIVSSKAAANYAAQSLEARRRVRGWSGKGARNPRAIETRALKPLRPVQKTGDTTWPARLMLNP